MAELRTVNPLVAGSSPAPGAMTENMCNMYSDPFYWDKETIKKVRELCLELISEQDLVDTQTTTNGVVKIVTTKYDMADSIREKVEPELSPCTNLIIGHKLPAMTPDVKTYIATSIRLFRWLKENRPQYCMADSLHREIENVGTGLSVLILVGEKYRPAFFGLFRRRNRRDCVCQIDFEEENKWSISVYGSSYLDEMKRFAEILSEEFNVSIEVLLEADKPLSETFKYDAVHY